MKGEYDAAYDDMGSIYDRIKEVCCCFFIFFICLYINSQQIGGSNAQLDMFEQTYIDVLTRSGHVGRALGILNERVKVPIKII